MLTIPIRRWGQDSESLETRSFVHFHTGEPLAKVSQTHPGLIAKDLRRAQRARDLLREIHTRELIARLGKAAELFKSAALQLGKREQTPDDFIRQQSGTTGLPEHLCRANTDSDDASQSASTARREPREFLISFARVATEPLAFRRAMEASTQVRNRGTRETRASRDLTHSQASAWSACSAVDSDRPRRGLSAGTE